MAVISIPGLRTRIAPTPSGHLHEGNAISFLITAALAVRHQGTLLLRIDDLDTERYRPAYVEDVFATLAWLGITWQEGPRDLPDFTANWSQQLRVARYQELLDALRAAGHLYACACSRKEQQACDCSARGLPFDASEHAWRLRTDPSAQVTMATWNLRPARYRVVDLMHDPVLRQRNGRPAYQIASLADDVDHAINFIVRGEDLLASTVCQLHLAGLLGFEGFTKAVFLHHPLITDGEGNKLSKSQDMGALFAMRSQGESPDRIKRIAEDLLARLS